LTFHGPRFLEGLGTSDATPACSMVIQAVKTGLPGVNSRVSSN
jgi:hypothetical protein